MALAFLCGLYPFIFIGVVREIRRDLGRLSPRPDDPTGRRVLQGIAAGEGALVAPISGRRCALWFVRIWSMGRPAKSTHGTEARAERLMLVGARESPLELVPARESSFATAFDVPARFPPREELVWAPGSVIPPSLLSRLGELEHYDGMCESGHSYTLHEYRIELGEPCTIAGGVETSSGRGARVRDALVLPGLLDEASKRYRRALIRPAALTFGALLAIPAVLLVMSVWTAR
jgi:hypothetical protein